jgi:hypothetical protein
LQKLSDVTSDVLEMELRGRRALQNKEFNEVLAGRSSC